MVTQAPRRAAVLVAIGFALSCIALMIFVWTQFAGPVPFAAQGYRVHARFAETGLLVPGADVRTDVPEPAKPAQPAPLPVVPPAREGLRPAGGTGVATPTVPAVRVPPAVWPER